MGLISNEYPVSLKCLCPWRQRKKIFLNDICPIIYKYRSAIPALSTKKKLGDDASTVQPKEIDSLKIIFN